MDDDYKNLVYAMTGQPVFPQYYQHQSTPLPRERTVREDLEEAARQVEEKERLQAAVDYLVNNIKCAANSYAHGYTYGISDELGGMAGTVGSMIANMQNGHNPLDDGQKNYKAVRDELRHYKNKCQGLYPNTTTAAEIMGLVSNPIKFIKTSSSAPRSIHLTNEVRNTGIGGGIYGFNSGEGDSWEHLKNIGRFAALGMIIPHLRRRSFPYFVPVFKGGELGDLKRGIADGILQKTITDMYDEK